MKNSTTGIFESIDFSEISRRTKTASERRRIFKMERVSIKDLTSFEAKRDSKIWKVSMQILQRIKKKRQMRWHADLKKRREEKRRFLRGKKVKSLRFWSWIRKRKTRSAIPSNIWKYSQLGIWDSSMQNDLCYKMEMFSYKNTRKQRIWVEPQF